MSEAWADWLSYRPSDFLMFSPRTYWRLFELHNTEWWPLQWLAVALGTVGGVAAHLYGVRANRLVAFGLAVAWAFVGWTFLAELYAPINWAVIGLAWLFVAQAVTLVGLALLLNLRGPAAWDQSRRLRRSAGARRLAAIALWAFALGIYPWLSWLQGRPLTQGEVFGLAPDPTVVATLAWLLATGGPVVGWGRWLRRAAWAMALACAAASAATLATMGEPQAMVMALAGVLSAACAWRWRADLR